MTNVEPLPEPPEERRAAAIVRAVTGCATKRLDVGDGAQRPDFALIDSACREIGVLEVTSITSDAHNSFFSRRTAKHRTWTDTALRMNWIATMDRATRRLQGLHGPVTAGLAVLERAGISWAVARPEIYAGRVSSAPSALVALGVVEVRAVSSRRGPGGYVTINVQPTGGSYGVESATFALEAVADQEDNRKKLASGLARRELFVWVEPPSAAASALSTFSDPLHQFHVAESRPPKLPAEATSVWAALWSDGETVLATALWRGDSARWQVIAPPEAGMEK